VHTSAVAGLDEELDVGVHEGHSHGHGGSVGEDKVGVVAETLDDVEDVVPATTVQARRVVTELVDDLVHLESGGDGLDEHGTTDGASGHVDVVLGQVEGIVPQPGFEV